jgi:hypothetical protein
MAVSELLPRVEDIQVYNGENATTAILHWNVPNLINPALIIEGYKIQRRVFGTTAWTTLGNTTDNKFIDDTLEFGNTYEWRVAVLYPEGTIGSL